MLATPPSPYTSTSRPTHTQSPAAYPYDMPSVEYPQTPRSKCTTSSDQRPAGAASASARAPERGAGRVCRGARVRSAASASPARPHARDAETSSVRYASGPHRQLSSRCATMSPAISRQRRLSRTTWSHSSPTSCQTRAGAPPSTRARSRHHASISTAAFARRSVALALNDSTRTLASPGRETRRPSPR